MLHKHFSQNEMFMLVKREKSDQAQCCGSSLGLEFYFLLINHMAFSYLYQVYLFLLCLLVAWQLLKVKVCDVLLEVPVIVRISVVSTNFSLPLSLFSWALRLLPEILRRILVQRWCSQEVLGLLGYQNETE